MNKKIKKCPKCDKKMKYKLQFHSHLNLFKPKTFFKNKIQPHIHQIYYCINCKYTIVIDMGFNIMSDEELIITRGKNKW